MSRPTVYFRWPSKDALVAEVIRSEFPADPLALASTGAAHEDLEALVVAGFRPWSGDPATGLADVARRRSVPFAGPSGAGNVRARQVEEVVAAGVASGELADHVDVEILADVLAGHPMRHTSCQAHRRHRHALRRQVDQARAPRQWAPDWRHACAECTAHPERERATYSRISTYGPERSPNPN